VAATRVRGIGVLSHESNSDHVDPTSLSALSNASGDSTKLREVG
jgi:hypothetical protein